MGVTLAYPSLSSASRNMDLYLCNIFLSFFSPTSGNPFFTAFLLSKFYPFSASWNQSVPKSTHIFLLQNHLLQYYNCYIMDCLSEQQCNIFSLLASLSSILRPFSTSMSWPYLSCATISISLLSQSSDYRALRPIIEITTLSFATLYSMFPDTKLHWCMILDIHPIRLSRHKVSATLPLRLDNFVPNQTIKFFRV